MAIINHFLGSFASDAIANAYVANAGWTVPGQIGGVTSHTRKPGLQYYNTTTAGIRTWNGTAWLEEGKAPVARTAADGDATPTVLDTDLLIFGANTAPLVITNLDNGVNGQIVTLYCSSAVNVPSAVDGGNFRLSGAWAPNQYDTLTLVRINAIWHEVARSAN